MHFYQSERVGVFIDGYHIYSVAKALGVEVDYKQLLKLFSTRCFLVRAYYFGISVDDAEYVATRPLTDWLQYNGYTVILRTVRHPGDTATIIRERARLDVEITVNIMTAADTLDHIVIITGEEAFASVVNALKRRGKVVTVISTLRTDNIAVSDNLRRAADHFEDLANLTEVLHARPSSSAMNSSAPRSKRSRGPLGDETPNDFFTAEMRAKA